MKLSIVAPILNEAENLPALTTQLASLQKQGNEIIVVDGGSQDGSAIVAKQAGFHVLQSPRGRAVQMNAGAAAATGDVLLFLHADTRLPNQAPQLITDALAPGNHVWGRFDVTITGKPFMLRVIAILMNWRSRFTGIATGDQAMFVTRAAFEAIGGFPVQPLMEDIELSQRLLKLSRPACLRPTVHTSGRRWESRGVWSTIFLMWRLRWAYWRGAAPEELARAYE